MDVDFIFTKIMLHMMFVNINLETEICHHRRFIPTKTLYFARENCVNDQFRIITNTYGNNNLSRLFY